MMTLAEMIVASVNLPDGFELVGFIDRHPAELAGWNAVVRSRLGMEMAWNGTALRSLPVGFRKLCSFEAAGNG